MSMCAMSSPTRGRRSPSEPNRHSNLEHPIGPERERLPRVGENIAHIDILLFHEPEARVERGLAEEMKLQAGHPLVTEHRLAPRKLQHRGVVRLPGDGRPAVS